MCFPTPLPRSRLFRVEPRNRTYSWAGLKVLKGIIQLPVTHHIPLGAPQVQAVASEDQGRTRRFDRVNQTLGSRMNREVHVRIWGRPEVRILRRLGNSTHSGTPGAMAQ